MLGDRVQFEVPAYVLEWSQTACAFRASFYSLIAAGWILVQQAACRLMARQADLRAMSATVEVDDEDVDEVEPIALVALEICSRTGM